LERPDVDLSDSLVTSLLFLFYIGGNCGRIIPPTGNGGKYFGWSLKDVMGVSAAGALFRDQRGILVCDAAPASKEERPGIAFARAVAAMLLILSTWALRAACRTSAARRKSSPSAAIARTHRSLILSSEFIAANNAKK
jgi:hypothetical protein